MKTIKTLILLLLLTAPTFAQKVYVTNKRYEADKLVFKVKYFCEAHLTVCKTDDTNEIGQKHHWYFVDSKHAADSGWVIFYVDKRYEADMCVYFTTRTPLLGYHHPVKTPVEPEIFKKKKSLISRIF